MEISRFFAWIEMNIAGLATNTKAILPFQPPKHLRF